MVIDTSALLAILLQEEEGAAFAEAIEEGPTRLLSAVSFLQTALVVETRKGPAGGRELDLALHHARVDIVPFDSTQAEIAREAYRRFGRGRHPAALNLGDCCAYALAVATREPLLFKGEDFAKTDLESWRK